MRDFFTFFFDKIWYFIEGNFCAKEKFDRLIECKTDLGIDKSERNWSL